MVVFVIQQVRASEWLGGAQGVYWRLQPYFEE